MKTLIAPSGRNLTLCNNTLQTYLQVLPLCGNKLKAFPYDPGICEEDTKSTTSNKCVFLQEDTKSTINSQIHGKKLKELYVGSWQISKIGIRQTSVHLNYILLCVERHSKHLHHAFFSPNKWWGVKSFLGVVKLYLTSEGEIVEGEFAFSYVSKGRY